VSKSFIIEIFNNETLVGFQNWFFKFVKPSASIVFQKLVMADEVKNWFQFNPHCDSNTVLFIFILFLFLLQFWDFLKR
jgi:hypothetical protein